MTAEPMTIAWIGTGVMGEPMAGHLMDAGHTLRVMTRTKAKAATLIERGATWHESPRAAAHGADIAISIVGFPQDVEAVHLGPDGTLAADSPPPIIVDMTTAPPSLAERIAARAAKSDIAAIDAPVSGGDIGARNATLSIMVGGPDDAVARTTPIFDTLGRNVVHHGGPGTGQHAKVVNQILVAASMIGACEGLLYAEAAGLDPERAIASVAAGAAGSWTISNLGPRIVAGDFAPGFFVEHFIKDLGIALDEAGRLGIALPGLALARQLYEAVRAQGHARLGTHALMLALRSMSGRTP